MPYIVVSGCTSGFMELDLLRRRAEKISGGISSTGAGGSLDDEFRLLPGENFSCSGTMTGILLVGTIMTGGGRDKYPEIQIHRHNDGNMYTRQGSETIELAEGDFSPDGVLQYNLTTPISYLYQPSKGKSVVRVYYREATVTTYQNSDSPMSSISLNDSQL